MEDLFRALVLGVKDYALKCNFSTALVGLSGGIDSALVAVIASAALGGNHVKALMMPSPWSSMGSITDSEALGKRLGLLTKTVPITSLMQSYGSVLKEPLGKSPEGITAENLQARIRGTIHFSPGTRRRARRPKLETVGATGKCREEALRTTTEASGEVR